MNRSLPFLFLALALGCSSDAEQPDAPETTETPPVLPTEAWRIEEIGDGLYLSVVRDDLPYAQFSNSLIVVGEEGVLVVDTRESPVAARDLLREIRARTDKPVTHVVNTHWHWDHVNGNQVFADSFPELEIVGHAETARLMNEEGPTRIGERVTALSEREVRLTRWIEQGATDDGDTLTAENLSEGETIVARDRANIAALSETRTVAPTETALDWVWSDPGRRVIVSAAPAHTPGDVVVWLPDDGVVYLGDLVEHGGPWLGDGDVTRLGPELNRIVEEWSPTLAIAGHGPTPDDASLLLAQRDYFQALNEALEAAAEPAALPDAVLEHLSGDAFASAFPSMTTAEQRRAYLDGLLDSIAPNEAGD